jgi:putative redox protein
MARAVAVTWLGNLKIEMRIGPHRLLADEPPEQGGEDSGPSPTELLLAALGA